jgi:hypothetical protein
MHAIEVHLLQDPQSMLLTSVCICRVREVCLQCCKDTVPYPAPGPMADAFNCDKAQAPMNAVLLWSVPPGVRPLAMSLSIVATHLLGDVPSPPLLGLLQGWLRNWR